MIINFKKTDLYYAIKYSWGFALVRLLKKISAVVIIILLICLVFKVGGDNLNTLIYLFLSIFLACFILDDFSTSGLQNIKPKKKISEVLKNPNIYNLAEFFDFASAKTICSSLKYAKKKKLKEVDCSLLLYFCIKNNAELNFIFSRIQLNPKIVKRALVKEIIESKKGKFIGFSGNFQKVILMALKLNKNRKDNRIEVSDLMAGLAEHSYILKTIITAKNIKPEDIKILSFWINEIKTKERIRKKWWKFENLLKHGSLARDWATPYSLTLDKYSKNLIDFIKKRKALLNKIIGRDKEMLIIEKILQKTEKNNVLIVIDLGAGRNKIINEIARKSFLGMSLPNVNYKKVVLLDLSLIISTSESDEKVSLILNKIFTEVINSKNIILIIDNIHNYIGQEKKPGIIDIMAVLTKFLSFQNFRIIGITSIEGYRKYLYPNEAFLSYFEKVEIPELAIKDTIKTLASLTFLLERQHKIFITYLAIKSTAYYADKYLTLGPLPGKAVNLLNDVIQYSIYNKKEKIIKINSVEAVIFEKTKIKVGKVDFRETNILLNLEDIIQKSLIGQEEAIKAVSASLRRARVEITIKGGPIGGFLFLGPTGVGKTELAKVLTKTYFGAEDKIIRVDMSEYQSISDIYRLIGSTTESGYLTTKVLENPFSLVLLDEIEKAHPDILNLFLQILDEGYVTDGVGKKINFKNTIIIATSNAASNIILDYSDKKIETEELKNKILDYIFKNSIFKPEFINRFDSVVLFHSLSKNNLLDISDLLLKKLQKNLKEKGIEFIFSNILKQKITELSYKPEYGAREMKRVIQDKIEDKIAISILNKLIKSGDKIRIDPETFEIKKIDNY